MQFPGAGKPPVGIVFDTGLSSPDEALAMALLFGFEGKGEARVISLSTTRTNLKAAAYCDAVARYYLRPQPIGYALDGKEKEPTAILAKPYPNSIAKLNDTADAAALIRNALTAQFDENAIVVLSGPATNLAAVLATRGAKAWIERKVKFLVAATSELDKLGGWPTPIVTVGPEVGDALPFPATVLDEGNPIAEAAKASTPGTALAAVLHAVRAKEAYFKVSGGKLVVDPEKKDQILKLYTEIASAKPVPRPQRFRPQQQQQQKKDEAKKP